ncbi:ER lumen protein-retaining receptor [Daphnia magna]|uniref:ER lumen protein retaining receptor n=1 Tax=Daphnia magna TaxID=35525 RepID=A0A0P6GCJ0_9CRUS|nr:ER lumen protein-retaining receptor [Daphnia magna]KZS01906.1 ER lumen protein-retaining receptor 2 [Daphnia magna]
MNIFRLLGDLSHLLAIVILLLKIWKTYSCAGISGKSQFLFALVYTTRYLDLFTYYYSLYNSFLKVVFIATSYGILYLIYVKFRATYDQNQDTFRVKLLLIPVAALALLFKYEFSVMEVLWAFSIYLEAVAILPQFYMMFKTGEAESMISYYLFALGSYRALYIFNWIYRYYYDEGFQDWIAVIAGIVQTTLYVCFYVSLYVWQTHDVLQEISTDRFKVDENDPTFTGHKILLETLAKMEEKEEDDDEEENDKKSEEETNLLAIHCGHVDES